MGDLGCSASFSSLLCPEDGTHLGEEDDDAEENNGLLMVWENNSLLSETEDEYIEILVSKESSSESSRTRDSLPEDWLKSARSDAVRWILKTSGFFRFCFKTAYIAITYLDRFFVHRAIDKGQSWAVQLLSIACLSLAAKMEESEAPVLSEFQLEEYEFSCDVKQKMELLVLNTLEWRMSVVTPFAYLGYFANKLQEHRSNELASEALELIHRTIEVINIADYRPSIIALAAILAASDKRLTQELVESKMSLVPFSGSLETAHVFSCYSMMIQESQKEELRPSEDLVSSSQPATNCVFVNNSVDANNATSCTETGRNKRRRLR